MIGGPRRGRGFPRASSFPAAHAVIFTPFFPAASPLLSAAASLLLSAAAAPSVELEAGTLARIDAAADAGTRAGPRRSLEELGRVPGRCPPGVGCRGRFDRREEPARRCREFVTGGSAAELARSFSGAGAGGVALSRGGELGVASREGWRILGGVRPMLRPEPSTCRGCCNT